MKAMKRSWHVSRPSGQGSRTEHSRSWTPSARTPTAIFPGIPSGIPDTSLSSMPPWRPVLPSKAAFPWKQPITSATSLSSAWTSAAPRKRFKSFWIRWSAHLPHKSAAAEKEEAEKTLPPSVRYGMDYIQNHLHERLTLAGLCREIHTDSHLLLCAV